MLLHTQGALSAKKTLCTYFFLPKTPYMNTNIIDCIEIKLLIFWVHPHSRVNGPRSICEKICNLTFSDGNSLIDISSAEHPHDCLMNMLKYCIRLWVLDAGWLTL